MRNYRLALLTCAIAICGGCAARTAATYRLVRQDNHPILIPPGVNHPDAPRQTFTLDVPPGHAPCPASEAMETQIKRKRLRVTVTSATLAAQPPGRLLNWSRTLDARGCIATGTGPAVAEEIVESVALDPATAFRVLHPNLVDFAPGTQIQVTSPVMRDGADLGAPLFERAATSEAGEGLTVTLNASADLLGSETDLYVVRSRSGAPGVEVSVLAAERKIQGRAEPLATPSKNYLRFPPSAAFYRLFYKGTDSGFTALIVAASTYEELDRRMAVLDTGTASCERVGSEWCAAIPKLVAFNIVLPVEVNGTSTSVRYGATIEEAIRGTGERHPDAVLAKLNVHRLYRGRKVAVQFDRTNSAILQVPLMGGEVLTWK